MLIIYLFITVAFYLAKIRTQKCWRGGWFPFSKFCSSNCEPNIYEDVRHQDSKLPIIILGSRIPYMLVLQALKKRLERVWS